MTTPEYAQTLISIIGLIAILKCWVKEPISILLSAYCLLVLFTIIINHLWVVGITATLIISTMCAAWITAKKSGASRQDTVEERVSNG